VHDVVVGVVVALVLSRGRVGVIGNHYANHNIVHQTPKDMGYIDVTNIAAGDKRPRNKYDFVEMAAQTLYTEDMEQFPGMTRTAFRTEMLKLFDEKVPREMFAQTPATGGVTVAHDPQGRQRSVLRMVDRREQQFNGGGNGHGIAPSVMTKRFYLSVRYLQRFVHLKHGKQIPDNPVEMAIIRTMTHLGAADFSTVLPWSVYDKEMPHLPKRMDVSGSEESVKEVLGLGILSPTSTVHKLVLNMDTRDCHAPKARGGEIPGYEETVALQISADAANAVRDEGDYVAGSDLSDDIAAGNLADTAVFFSTMAVKRRCSEYLTKCGEKAGSPKYPDMYAKEFTEWQVTHRNRGAGEDMDIGDALRALEKRDACESESG